MTLRLRGPVLLVVALTAASCAPPSAGHPSPAGAHWAYEGEEGPAHWGELAPAYAACAQGRRQSPVDLTAAAVGPLPRYDFAYAAHPPTLHNNGHTVQVSAPAGSALTVDGERFALLQYHFHTPSEHTVEGVRYPAELHLVHEREGRLLVLGVLIREGAENAGYQPLLDHLPPAGEQRTASAPHSGEALLPAEGPVFRYPGSLTTPPCTEGVDWNVLATPVELSAAQIARLREVMGMNSRPVQPLHGRAVRLHRDP